MKWIAIGIFLLLVVGAGAFVATQNDSRTESGKVSVSPSPTDSATPVNNAVGNTPTKGTYLDYSDEVLAQTSGNRVLFFHAPWCPQCRSIESGIKQDGVPDGWTVIKVDYDSNQDLRKKYGVSLQTTFVKIDESDTKVGENYVAYEQPTFSTVVSNFLNN